LRQKLEDEIQEKDMEIEDLLEKVEEMTKALRKGGKVADCELNEQLKERVTAAAKEYLFRIVRLCPPKDTGWWKTSNTPTLDSIYWKH